MKITDFREGRPSLVWAVRLESSLAGRLRAVPAQVSAIRHGAHVTTEAFGIKAALIGTDSLFKTKPEAEEAARKENKT